LTNIPPRPVTRFGSDVDMCFFKGGCNPIKIAKSRNIRDFANIIMIN
jgi:hypothetical protein